ncbi:MAG: hypothetical protein WC956_01180 [bacterium]
MKFISILSAALALTSISIAAHAAPVNRNILAVIDSAEVRGGSVIYGDATPGADSYSAETSAPPGQNENIIEKYAEMPLEHLGYVVSYVDVTKRLPDDAEMQKYGAIISWFLDNNIKGSTDYGRWLTRQLGNGKKLIALGEFGFDFDDKNNETPDDVLKDFFKAFLVQYKPADSTESQLLIEIAHNDPPMTEFERNLKGGLTNFRNISVLDKSARVFLKLRRKDTGTTSDAVFIHSKGGYALPDYIYYENYGDLQTRWRINPFKFFAQALGQDFPKPDISTLNGMRLFYSHIDGDGFASISRIEKEKTCGQVTYDNILTRYNLPVSASVIIGDIVQTHGNEKARLVETAKKIFALPNVEPASHGWAHPLIWTAKGRKMALALPGYTYSPENEIGNSIKYINDNLVPAGKKTDLFFWTGNCRPDYDALKYVSDNSILAINGGDTRLDNAYPSYTYVAPLFHHVEDLIQDFSSNANEIVYTNIWTGPFYGFRYAIETYKRTESPMRIRPIDVYYHYFSMEREISAEALTQVYDWTLAQEIAPVFASDYLKNLKGFLSAKIERADADRWIISETGDLRTVRFDNYEGYVDLERSSGVLGFVSYQGSLYVHLDNGERAEIALTKTRPSRAYLVKANGLVRGWKSAAGTLSFELHAIGRAQFTIGGLKAGHRYKVDLIGKSFDIDSNDSGELSLSQELLKNRFEWTVVEIKEG